MVIELAGSRFSSLKRQKPADKRQLHAVHDQAKAGQIKRGGRAGTNLNVLSFRSARYS